MRQDDPFSTCRAMHTQGEMALLPSPFATLLWSPGYVQLFGPHDRLYRARPTGAAYLMFCMPTFIKALLGHPRYFLNQQFSVEALPLLAPFQESSPTEWPTLLQDLRAAVVMTHDEYQFTELWYQLIGQPCPINDVTPERQAERLCRRYAGQPPTSIGRQLRLATQLSKDLATGTHEPTGAYSDQSHYIRECRKHTGRSPGEWQNVSATFYHCDTDITIISGPTSNTADR